MVAPAQRPDRQSNAGDHMGARAFPGGERSPSANRVQHHDDRPVRGLPCGAEHQTKLSIWTDAMNRTRLSKQLEIDEGRRRRIYLDNANPPRWTGGVGRNLSDRGFSDDEIDLMLKNDIDESVRIAKGLVPVFEQLDDVRQEVLCNMAFNLGIVRLGGFKRFLSAVNRHDYQAASTEMQDSAWYSQVGDRAKRLVQAMREGKFP